MVAGVSKVPLVALLISLMPMVVTAEDGRPLSAFNPPLTAQLSERLQQATVARGEQLFERKCSACHDYRQRGGHGKGPHLWNVVGRKAGSIENFEFSEAMRGSGHLWTLAALDYYLTRTDIAVPGRAMNFRGLANAADRADLLRFLSQQSDTPVEFKP